MPEPDTDPTRTDQDGPSQNEEGEERDQEADEGSWFPCYLTFLLYTHEPLFDLLAQKSLSCPTYHKQLSDDWSLKTCLLSHESTRVRLPCLEARSDLTFLHEAGGMKHYRDFHQGNRDQQKSTPCSVRGKHISTTELMKPQMLVHESTIVHSSCLELGCEKTLLDKFSRQTRYRHLHQ